MKPFFKIILIISQLILSQSCFQTLDKNFMFNTSIQSTNNVYNHKGDNFYQGSKSLDLDFSTSNDSINNAMDYYNQPVIDPLGN